VANQRVVLIEYFCTDDVTLVFGVRADWDEPKVVEVAKPLKEIRAFVVQHFGVQTTRDSATAPSVYEKVQSLDLTAWQEFFAPFIAPIREWADEGDILWLVPHDVLHYLPLHALQLDGKYLIERHPILYTPSASVMKYCQAKRTNRSRRNALVLGDSENNLPFAREEASSVAERFNTLAYLGERATKTLLKEKLAREKETLDILHFACHGYFDPYQPLKSGILLAKNGDEDAKLTAEEIFGLEMHADLVVLSACESGVNERKSGDELIGLTRALIYAGTPSVLVSLWQVNDLSTLILMENFYRELAKDSNKAQALQQAQLALMNMSDSEVRDYISGRVNTLNATGQQARAHSFENLAYPSLLAAERYNPRKEKEWRPFSHLAAWAPFILVGDWK